MSFVTELKCVRRPPDRDETGDEKFRGTRSGQRTRGAPPAFRSRLPLSFSHEETVSFLRIKRELFNR